MCGFVVSVVPKTGYVLRHRGPDGIGALHAGLSWAHVNVEMTRLAIIDRRSLSVPFDFRKSCGVTLAFNGEIFNHHELRAELSDGQPWETDCDAEVVARAWRKWGPEMLHKLNGMWGMCLTDEKTNEVFLARDRAGEKPLYYARVGTGVAFASEIKALPVKFEEVPCEDMDVFEFDCLERTPFRGVYRLGPGECLRLRSPEDVAFLKPQKWWMLGTDVDTTMTWENAVEETKSLIEDAVRIRAQAEVPVGIQVSGGLDSAIVQAIAKIEKVYTVGFPKNDEQFEHYFRLARFAAGCEPTLITFGMEDLLGALPAIAYHLDTPATWTAVCQWFMCRRMAEDGCVITLSGEGADELFGGYARYRFLYWLERAFQDERLNAYNFVRERLFGKEEDVLARLLDRSDGHARERALEIVRRFSIPGAGLLVNAMRVDFYASMAVLLRMPDRMAAASSMENRAIFFDYRLMELSSRMPMKYKVTEFESKAVLVEVAKRLGVPSPVTGEKTKRGLFVPWSKWSGSKGWDRSSFAEKMKTAWRRAFFGSVENVENKVAFS